MTQAEILRAVPATRSSPRITATCAERAIAETSFTARSSTVGLHGMGSKSWPRRPGRYASGTHTISAPRDAPSATSRAMRSRPSSSEAATRGEARPMIIGLQLTPDDAIRRSTNLEQCDAGSSVVGFGIRHKPAPGDRVSTNRRRERHFAQIRSVAREQVEDRYPLVAPHCLCPEPAGVIESQPVDRNVRLQLV